MTEVSLYVGGWVEPVGFHVAILRAKAMFPEMDNEIIIQSIYY